MDNTGQQSAVLHASVMPFLGKEKSEGNYFCPKLLLPLPVRLCPTFLWPDIRPRYFHPLQPANKRGQEKGKDNIPFISLPFACTAIWEPSVNCSHIWESHQSLNRCCILKCPHLKLASYQMYPIPPKLKHPISYSYLISHSVGEWSPHWLVAKSSCNTKTSKREVQGNMSLCATFLIKEHLTS